MSLTIVSFKHPLLSRKSFTKVFLYMTCKLGTHRNQLANARFIVLNQSGATETNRDLGCFHYARPTSGLPKENGTTFCDQTGPTKGNGKFRSNRSDRSEWTISRGGHEYFGHTEQKRLSIWLPTEISGIFGIMESTLNFREFFLALRVFARFASKYD